MDVAKDHLVADFIQHAAKAADLHELGELFFKTLSKLGFTEWGYQEISQNTEKPVVLSTFPREWVAYYLENNLCKVDPLITKVPKTFTPFQWSELLKTETLKPQQKKYWAEADDYGLRDGIGIPIHSHKGQLSIVTLVSRKMHPNELSRIFHEYRSQVHIISLVYNSYASAMLASQASNPNPPSLQTANSNACSGWRKAKRVGKRQRF